MQPSTGFNPGVFPELGMRAEEEVDRAVFGSLRARVLIPWFPFRLLYRCLDLYLYPRSGHFDQA
ncbi:hypothetical protein BT96DRAFT_927431 [Gymnopus androsaceus JB14]|uniref:Uncharacterized protein n=1 Tax=Gymnopus androsaceus JB14 TaxID=1447944 RepID=A0A6A4GPS9_9AGAR|nr:hypothetical protein BT96DRAFT_927431 [Gymnopus androsaceus JB14]